MRLRVCFLVYNVSTIEVYVCICDHLLGSSFSELCVPIICMFSCWDEGERRDECLQSCLHVSVEVWRKRHRLIFPPHV